MVAPCVVGVMLGSLVGVKLFRKVRSVWVRRMVIIMLLLAGSRAIWRGIELYQGA